MGNPLETLEEDEPRENVGKARETWGKPRKPVGNLENLGTQRAADDDSPAPIGMFESTTRSALQPPAASQRLVTV